MGSTALDVWNNESRGHLQELYDAHALITGERPGRRWVTRQINHALIMALSAQFQRYARSLFIMSVTEYASRVALGNDSIRSNLTTVLGLDSQLASRNAQPGSIGSDFKRLGVDMVRELKRDHSGMRTTGRERDVWRIDLLSHARNGVAHGDAGQLDHAERNHALGPPTMRKMKHADMQTATPRAFNLREIRAIHGSCGRIAHRMDKIASNHLATLSATAAPW